MAKLRAADLQQLYNLKRDNGRKDKKGGLSARSVHLLHTVCHAALEQAVNERLIAVNESKFAHPPREAEAKEIHPMDLDQVRHFLEVNKEGRLYAAFYLLFFTGIRRGEVLGLKWSDIDSDKRTMHIQRSLVTTATKKVQFHPTKTPKSKRLIPLTPDVIRELESHRERQDEEKQKLQEAYIDSDMVFCREDGVPIHPDVFYSRFQKLLEKAKLPAFRVHDTRHTFATIALKAGEHVKVVQEILGHSSAGLTLNTYSHVLPGLKEQAMLTVQTAVLKPVEVEKDQSDDRRGLEE